MKIGITMGDPRGIGPEIIMAALEKTRLKDQIHFLIYGDAQIFSNLSPSSASHATPALIPISRGPVGLSWTDEECGHASILCLERAVRDALAGKLDALVTAPICKAHIQKAGYDYPGHTEFLAEKTGTEKVVMMMASPTLKVTLVTIHVPLQEVPRLLTAEKIRDTVKSTTEALKTYWGLNPPRVAVAGLNPHAGEEGILGREEIEIIGPSLRRLREEGYEVDGPAVPDAVFHQAHEG